MVQPTLGSSMAQNPDITNHPSPTASEIDFQSSSLPHSVAQEDAWLDDLWALADATVAEDPPLSSPPPLMLPQPMPTSPTQEEEVKDHRRDTTTTEDPRVNRNPISLLSIAGDMAVTGRASEARQLRKRAMLLMQVMT